MEGRSSYLSRRAFVAGAAGLGLLVGCGRLPWQEQAPRVAQIGLLSPKPTYAPDIQAFRDGLRDLGYAEGQEVAIHYREYGLAPAEGVALADLATELAGLRVDVIVADGGPAIDAAQAVAATIPLVRLSPNVGGRRLALLLEACPGTARVAVLWNPTSVLSAVIWQEAQTAAPPLGIALQSLEVRAPEHLDNAL